MNPLDQLPRYAADTILRTALKAASDIDPVHGDPAKLTSDQVRRWITRNWTPLAAKVYWVYTRSGGGCLFVFVRGTLPAKVDWRRLTGVYLPMPGVIDLLDGSELVIFDMALEIGEDSTQYEPARKAVICVANPTWEQWAVFRLAHPLVTPPRAYAVAGEQVGVEMA